MQFFLVHVMHFALVGIVGIFSGVTIGRGQELLLLWSSFWEFVPLADFSSSVCFPVGISILDESSDDRFGVRFSLLTLTIILEDRSLCYERKFWLNTVSKFIEWIRSGNLIKAHHSTCYNFLLTFGIARRVC